MTLYQSPDTVEGDTYQGKFVRAGDQVAIGLDNDFKQTHRDIAEQDGLLPGLRTLVTETPIEVDAGLLNVYKGYSGKPGRIIVLHHSSTLGLPATDEARTRSGVILEQLSPGYRVEVETGVYMFYKLSRCLSISSSVRSSV